jgi:hypothetical protein
MGRGFDIPWVGGVKIPWIAGQITIGRGVKIPYDTGTQVYRKMSANMIL